jgi:hypothetical protein
MSAAKNLAGKNDKCTFQCLESLTEKGLKVSLSGFLNENCHLETVGYRSHSQIAVDLREVRYINSIGVRKFIDWLWKIERGCPRSSVHLESVSPVMMRQILMIKDSLPKNIHIESIMVALFCEPCDFEDQSQKASFAELMSSLSKESGFDFDFESRLGRNCPHCEQKMEFDLDARRYLELVRGRKF